MYSSSLDRYRKAFNETKHKKRVIYFDGVRGETNCQKLLNDKNRPDMMSNRSKKAIMVQNLFFLTAIS